MFSELEPDVVFHPAPLTQGQARRLLSSIKAKEILQGFRGMKPVNQKLLAEIVVKVAGLGVSYPRIGQIDLNPVIISQGEPWVVDANIIFEKEV